MRSRDVVWWWESRLTHMCSFDGGERGCRPISVILHFNLSVGHVQTVVGSCSEVLGRNLIETDMLCVALSLTKSKNPERGVAGSVVCWCVGCSGVVAHVGLARLRAPTSVARRLQCLFHRAPRTARLSLLSGALANPRCPSRCLRCVKHVLTRGRSLRLRARCAPELHGRCTVA